MSHQKKMFSLEFTKVKTMKFLFHLQTNNHTRENRVYIKST